MKRAIQTWIVGALLAAAATGCGRTVEDVCEDIDDACPGFSVDECIADGEHLESVARQNGCFQRFDAYLDCLATPVCAWEDVCEPERQALEACTGTFPL